MGIPVLVSSLSTHRIPIINPTRTTTGRIQFSVQIDVLHMPLAFVNFVMYYSFEKCICLVVFGPIW